MAQLDRVDDDQGLEQALRDTQVEADAALKTAAAATTALKHVRAVVQVGNLRDLNAAFAAAERALAAAQHQFARLKGSWQFDEEAYFSAGAYARELLATAREMGVRIVEADDRLYCYPMLVRVLGSERTVLIDRLRERRLRPTVLVSHLKDLQKRPARFKPEVFLEALHAAYSVLVERRGEEPRGSGAVARLLDVYALLTLLPGQRREYSRQEFARDIYLLDRSGVTTVQKGEYTLGLPSSTGTKSASGTITVITESGREQTYYGIAFTRTATG